MILLVVMIAEGMTPHRGYAVDLAMTSTAIPEPSAARENAITVMISRDGSIFFHNLKIAPDELSGSIRKAVSEGSEKRDYLKVDSRAKYADIKYITDLIDQAGIWNVTFLVEKRIGKP
ncbi:MAG: biopolymer transporter ExbD [Acidobacteria bacterium]|nr:biopolymer transporter ExbD [Acidobacteriota bacterium]MBS1865756.1 biopolymer transporter ExbD [Acidobacteriota bacterium]